MAEQWTPPEEGKAEQPFRAFSRQALEATLAEALRDVERSGESAEADESQRVDAEKPPVRRANPFGRPVTPEPAAAPRPVSGINNLVNGTLAGRPAAVSGEPGVSRLSAPGSTPGGGAALGSLRPPGLSDLSGGRTVSGYSQAPTEEPSPQATIALRRPSRPEPQHAAAAHAPAPESAAPPAPHPTPKPMTPIAAWSPSDDDILPKGAVKRRSFRFKR